MPLKVTLGGHSTLDPPLPIPNRVVKRSRADDSVFSHAKVGHCQAPYRKKPRLLRVGAFLLIRRNQLILAYASFHDRISASDDQEIIRRGNHHETTAVFIPPIFIPVTGADDQLHSGTCRRAIRE